MASIADFGSARDYALALLARELSPRLCYHSLRHTRDDVVPAAERLATIEALDDGALLLVRTAAYCHDLGFVVRRAGHERASVEIAAGFLPGCGYTDAQIAVISGMIMATRLPQTPATLLEQIVADADLEVLGRADFLDRNQELRNEIEAFDGAIDDADWYRGQLMFLHGHRYWTASARRLRDTQKKLNSIALAALLEGCGPLPNHGP